ncbi:hypothetical protein [uncultured Aurantimicrobium sp.]|uniref:hypothetical protein n=1 Tax=uncultured Aurantimicrobium sp. TaxID=1705357 RepID=UPI0026059231|nr:hypothetical protein [uncultured Aurantimicrobium sp.]
MMKKSFFRFRIQLMAGASFLFLLTGCATASPATTPSPDETSKLAASSEQYIELCVNNISQDEAGYELPVGNGNTASGVLKPGDSQCFLAYQNWVRTLFSTWDGPRCVDNFNHKKNNFYYMETVKLVDGKTLNKLCGMTWINYIPESGPAYFTQIGNIPVYRMVINVSDMT